MGHSELRLGKLKLKYTGASPWKILALQTVNGFNIVLTIVVVQMVRLARRKTLVAEACGKPIRPISKYCKFFLHMIFLKFK